MKRVFLFFARLFFGRCADSFIDEEIMEQQFEVRITSLFPAEVEILRQANEISQGMLVIPNEVMLRDKVFKVTAVGDKAFCSDAGIVSVKMFEGITAIGADAFDGCENLVSVGLPPDLVSIGANAFGSCYKLTSITLPSGLTTIGDKAFWGCMLNTVNIPAGVHYRGPSAFLNTKHIVTADPTSDDNSHITT